MYEIAIVHCQSSYIQSNNFVMVKAELLSHRPPTTAVQIKIDYVAMYVPDMTLTFSPMENAVIFLSTASSVQCFQYKQTGPTKLTTGIHQQ